MDKNILDSGISFFNKKKPRVPLSSEEQKLFCFGLASWCPCDDCQSDESIAARLVEESAMTVAKSC